MTMRGGTPSEAGQLTINDEAQTHRIPGGSLRKAAKNDTHDELDALNQLMNQTNAEHVTSIPVGTDEGLRETIIKGLKKSTDRRKETLAALKANDTEYNRRIHSAALESDVGNTPTSGRHSRSNHTVSDDAHGNWTQDQRARSPATRGLERYNALEVGKGRPPMRVPVDSHGQHHGATGNRGRAPAGFTTVKRPRMDTAEDTKPARRGHLAEESGTWVHRI